MSDPVPDPGGIRRRVRRTMPAGEVLFIFRARLKSRVVFIQESLAVLGIAIGVALLFASQVASQSLDGSVRQLTHQLVGGTQYQLDARGPTGFPETLVNTAQAIPGVRAALPLVDQQAAIIGPKGRTSVDLIGVDPQFAKLGGPLARKFSGRELSHQRVIALPSRSPARSASNPSKTPTSRPAAAFTKRSSQPPSAHAKPATCWTAKWCSPQSNTRSSSPGAQAGSPACT